MDVLDPIIIENIKDLLPKKPLIFDVGACNGQYTDFLLSIIDSPSLFLFEPNDLLVEQLDKKYNISDGIRIIHTLIGATDGLQKFHYFDDNHYQISSIYYRPVFHDLPLKIALTRCTTIDTILQNWSIDKVDFIKVDVEGAEFDVLKGAKKSMQDKKIDFIQVEYGGTYPDAGITFMGVIKYVNGLGYFAYSFQEKFVEMTTENFVEDFRYENFLITNRRL